VQFPLDKPIPLALIGKIVKFRVAENLQLAKAKTKEEISVYAPDMKLIFTRICQNSWVSGVIGLLSSSFLATQNTAWRFAGQNTPACVQTHIDRLGHRH